MALESSADEAHLQGQASAEELDPSTADGREQAVIGCHVRHSALTPEAQKRIKAICFDLDDTLWDNSEVLAAACAAHTRWLAERHPDVEQPLRAAPLGHRMMSIAKRQTHLSHCYTLLREAAVREVLAEAQLPPSEHEGVVEASMAHYLKARSDVVLFDGALEALQILKARGYALAALSNGNADVHQVPALREAGDVFAVHLHPGKVGAAKPHGAAFQAVCKALGVEPHEVLHVGDCITSDVGGALRAGMHAVHVDPTAMATGQPPPHYSVVTCVQGVLHLLQQGPSAHSCSPVAGHGGDAGGTAAAPVEAQ